jgi:hypothetical protein
MTFKPKIWYPIATILSALNVALIYFAAQPGEAIHATVHGALAVAFALWAQRLRLRQLRGQENVPTRLEEVDAEVGQMRQELSEAQERLDFAERMLAQRPETRVDR